MQFFSGLTSMSGSWSPGEHSPPEERQPIKDAVRGFSKPVYLVEMNGRMEAMNSGTAVLGRESSENGALPLYAYAPPLRPEDLGDPVFKKTHNLRYAYIAGAMANGITSADMVEAAARAGFLAFFGAGGLTLDKIGENIDRLKHSLGDLPFGFNLIHSPGEPAQEQAVVDLYLEKGVRLVSAAAYMQLTLPLVYYRVKGIYRNENGEIICPNRVIGKVSRIEVARKFFSPPPEKLIARLLDEKRITPEEAELSQYIPMAEDLSAEADSGGHTDNRPALALLPTMLALRDEMVEKFPYAMPLRVGLGGGIATPASAAAAFAMGAAYILTGSVNQSCVEAGTSEVVRKMLADAEQADVTMAPAADMFEMGVKVQVLKRGTMFALKGAKLYELYRTFNSLEEIPEKQKKELEDKFFFQSLDAEWEQTKRFFESRDPKQIEKARQDPKHKMALVFRSYLGRAALWSISGDPTRRMDYQIWCGPAMGAFNEWVKGSFLEKPENRKVATVAMNLLAGACIITRINWLKAQGISFPTEVCRCPPTEIHELEKL